MGCTGQYNNKNYENTWIIVVFLLIFQIINLNSPNIQSMHFTNDKDEIIITPLKKESGGNSITMEEIEEVFNTFPELKQENPDQKIKIPFTGFIENIGQTKDQSIRYYYSTKESFIGFGTSKIFFMQTIHLEEENKTESIGFELTFPQSQRQKPSGIGKKSHSTNFFYGSNQYSNVPSWDEIWYYNLYDNINLRYYMTEEGLKYEFIVLPGGNPKDIVVKANEQVILTITAMKVSMHPKNHLDRTIITDDRLMVYEKNGKEIPAEFIQDVENQNSYRIKVEIFNPKTTLIIDPIWLGFSTYLGGEGSDKGNGVTIDNAGSVYITGQTGSSDFPTANENQTDQGGNDAFIIKLNPIGNGLVYSTYLGGGDSDEGKAIAVDSSGNAYITGITSSTDYPTINAYQTDQELTDAFVTKLNSAGNTIAYSTYLGGGSYDYGMSIAIDSAGNAFVVGWTRSTNFPTVNEYQTDKGSDDVFVAKLNPTGNDVVYSTYIGGGGPDYAEDIVIDSSGNAYITGQTGSTDYPTVNEYQTDQGGNDAFVTKLNSTGNGLVYSTYIGGGSTDVGYGIAIDSSGNAYITGYTFSTDFPTVNEYQTDQGAEDVFVSKLNPTGDGLVYSTYLGGGSYDHGKSIAVDGVGNAYITGITTSTDYPTINEYQTDQLTTDIFVTKLNASGNDLVYSTYIGGGAWDDGKSIAVDGVGNAYITGYTLSTNFPTINEYQTDQGGTDVFVFKISVNKFGTCLGGGSSDYGVGIALDDTDNVFITGYTLSTNFPTVNEYQTDQLMTDIFVSKLNTTGNGLVYSTYLGGGSSDYGYAIAIDTVGNAYITGYTFSTDYPTVNEYQTDQGSIDAFVTKLNATGNGLIYSTYLGGGSFDYGRSIAVDGVGNAYITGYTDSTNFPTANEYQTDQGGTDVFVTKLNATGKELVYSTYLGGGSYDVGWAIAVDSSGNAYITGQTGSINFPTANEYQNDQGGNDAFVTQLNPIGNGLVYSTYLGGGDFDEGKAITVDSSGNAYITGSTSSSDFPTANAYQTDQGGTDIFVTKLTSTGNGLIYSTYLGGGGTDVGYGIAIDTTGNAYIGGYTSSLTYPTLNEFQANRGGTEDAIITKLNSTGNSLIYSTYLGGGSNDYGTGIVLDSTTDIAYVVGWTFSSDFPTNAIQQNQGDEDVFVFKYGLHLDNDTPQIQLRNLSNNSFLQGGISIILDIFDNTSILDEVLYNWDSGTDQIWSITNQPTLPSVEGQHILSVYANESANHWSTATFIFTTDDTVPGVTLTNPVNNTEQQSGTAININITDVNTLQLVEYNWDGGGGVNTTIFLSNSSFAFTAGLPAPEGQHILQIYTQDNAGNWNYTIFVFITDDTVPDVKLTNPVNNTEHKSGTTLNINITDVNTLQLVEYNWDGGGSNISVDLANSSHTFTTNLPNTYEGAHTLHVYAQDNAGNWNNTHFVFIIDDTAPEIVLINPANNTELQSSTVYTINVTDVNTLFRVRYNWDGGSNNSVTLTNNSYEFSKPMNPSIGAHALNIYAVDNADNWNYTVFVFVTDDITPNVTLMTHVNNTELQSTTPISINIIDTNTLQVIEYNWDGTGNTTVVLNNSSYTFITFSPITEGQHTLHVYIQDNAGNWNYTVYMFVTDDAPPSITLTTPTNRSIQRSGTTIDLIITGTNGSLIYHWDFTDNITVTDNFNPTLPTIEGVHRLYIYVTDEVGNWNSLYFEFTTDDTNPIISLISPTNNSVQKGGTSIDLSIIDANDLDQVVYNWDDFGNNSLFNLFNVSLIEGDGQHSLHIYAQDVVGNWANKEFKFITDDSPPVIELINLETGAILPSGTLINLTISDTHEIIQVLFNWDDTDNSTLEAPYDLSLVTGNGLHTLRVFALDEAGNWASESFIFNTQDEETVLNGGGSFPGLTELIISLVASILGTVIAFLNRRLIIKNYYRLRHRDIFLRAKKGASPEVIAEQTGKTIEEVRKILERGGP